MSRQDSERDRDLDGWIEAYWGWAGVAAFLLLSVDLLTSLGAAAAVGVEHESNPLMAWLLVQPTAVLIGVHLAAALLILLLLYGLQELVREAPDSQQRFLMLSAEAFLGLLVAAGLFLLANNLSVIVLGRSLL